MELDQLILIGLVLMVGSAIQSAAGFGFGLFAIPLLLLVDFASYEAIAIVGACAMVQCGLGAWKLRRYPHWRSLWPLVPFVVIMQPIGAMLQKILNDQGPALVKQVFGGVLLTVLASQWLLKPKPREKVAYGWGVFAMTCSGLLSGLTGTSGPPVVLWAMAHDWTTQRIRASMFAIFMAIIPINLVFQSLEFGTDVIKAAGIGLAYAPVVWLGVIPGLWLGNQLSQKAIRRVAFSLLFVIAAYMVAEPVIG